MFNKIRVFWAYFLTYSKVLVNDFFWNYLASTLVSPGLSTEMDPAQAHIVLLDSNMAGKPPILSFLATGLQGIRGIGIQEEGTKTGMGPAIFQFIGLAGDLHWPKAGIFKKGIISIWVAIGLVVAFIAIPIGSTIMSLEPEPKEHFNLAPMQTHFGIYLFFLVDEYV